MEREVSLPLARGRIGLGMAAALALAAVCLSGCGGLPRAAAAGERATLLTPIVHDDGQTTGTSGMEAWLRRFERRRQWTAAPSDERQPDVSPDARLLTYVSDEEGSPDIYLFDLPPAPARAPRKIAGSPADESSPRFSPDGRRLAYVSTIDDAFGDVWIVEVRSGKTRRLTDRATRDADPAWLPDGSGIVYSAAAGGAPPRLMQLDLDSGERGELPAPPGATQADVSSDGEFVVYVAADEQGARRLALLEMTSGRRVDLTDGAMPVAAPRFEPGDRSILYACGADDTNANGRLDGRDNWTLWRVDLSDARQARFRPLTLASRDVRGAAPFGDGFFAGLAEAARAPADIVSMGPEGALPMPPGGATHLGRAAWLTRRQRPYEEDLAIGVWRLAAGAEGADEELARRARFEILSLVARLGRLDQAAALAVELIDSLPLDSPVAGRAAVEWERVRLAQVERATAQPERLADARRQAIERLETLRRTHDTSDPARRRAAAEAALLAARVRQDMNDLDGALSEAESAAKNYGDVPGVEPRAMLLKGYVLERLGLGDQARRALLAVVSHADARRGAAFEAARRLIAIALARAGDGRSPEAGRKQLRALIAMPDIPPLVRAVARNRIGDLYVEEERLPEALEAYAETAERYPDEVEAVAASHFARSRVLYDQGLYAESVRMYETIEKRLRPRDDDFYRRARRGYIRQTILKAEAEYRLGDPLLARATYEELADYDGTLYEPWRGILRTDAASGRVAQTMARIEESLAATPTDSPARPALLYARGLALTYLPGRWKEAEEVLRRVAVVDPAAAYPHQTLGYLYEQRMIRDAERSAASQALYEYQLAIALGDADLNPPNAAALLVNAGNVCRLLDLWGLAQYYYALRAEIARRGDPAAAFEDPRTEFLFWRHAGQAAFKAGDPQAAADYLVRALEMLPALREKFPDEADWRQRQTELTDRLALARQETGQYGRAAERFDQVVRRADDARARALATRNRAVNLYLQARDEGGSERTERLSEAWRAFHQARDTVRRAGVIAPDQRRKRARGLLNLAVVVGLGSAPASQAGQGFDKDGELRLIEGFLGHIAEADGDLEAARESIARQLDALPEIDNANRAYVQTERAVLLSRLAGVCQRLGRRQEALEHTLASLEACSWGRGDERTVNVGGASAAVCNLARLWAARPEAVSLRLVDWVARRAIEQSGDGAGEMARQARDDAARNAVAFASEVLLGLLDETAESARQSAPGLAPAIEPELAFARGAIELTRADTIAAEKTGEGVALIEKTARELACRRRAAEAFGQSGALVSAAWSAFQATSRARLRRMAVAADLQHARCLTALGRREEAHALADAALRATRAWHYPDLAFAHFFQSGLCAEPDARIDFWERAFDTLDGKMPTERLGGAFHRAALGTVGAALARQAAIEEDWELAWWYSEWAAAQVLAQAMATARPEFGRPQADLEARRIYAALDAARTEIDAMRRSDAPVDPSDADLARTLEAVAKWDTATTQGQVYELSLTMRGEPMTLADVIDTSDEKTGLLRIASLGDAMLVVVATAQGVDGRVVEDDAFRLIARSARRDTDWPEDDLAALGRAVLQPFANTLASLDRIVLVSDAACAGLPIEWAPGPGGAAAIERWTFVRSLSCRQFYLSQTAHSPWRRSILAAGKHADRALDKNVYRVRSLEEAGNAAGLADALREADAAMATWPLSLDGWAPWSASMQVNPDSTAPDARLRPVDLFAGRWGLSCLAAPLAVSGKADATATDYDTLHFTMAGMLWGGANSFVAGPADKSAPSLWKPFWSAFAGESPAGAMRQALLEAHAQGAAPGDLAAWRVYGSPGMNRETAEDFLEENLIERIGAAEAAKEAKDYIAAATGYSQVLRLLESVAPGDERIPFAQQHTMAAARRTGDADLGLETARAYRQWLESHGADIGRIAEARRLAAVFLSERGDTDEAVAEGRRAIETFRQADNPEGVLSTLKEIALFQENGGRPEEALATLETARALCAEFEAPGLEARQLLRIARIQWLRRNRYAQAVEAARRALDLARQAQDPAIELDAWMDIASAQERRARFDEALEACERAEALVQSLDDAAQVASARARISLRRADVLWLTGDYRDALLRYADALEGASQAGSDLVEIAARNGHALLYWTLNQYDRAMAEAEQALALARRIEQPDEQAATYNNIGLIWRSRGDYSKALESFGHALRIDEAIGLPWGIAYDYRNIGITRSLAGQPDQGAQDLERAAAMSRRIGDPVNLAKAMLGLGDARRQTDETDPARQAYGEALDIARKRGLPEVAWRALDGLARLDTTLGDRDGARARLLEAIEIVEGMRASIRVEELQDGFLADKQDLYERMIRLLLDEGLAAQAFEFNERARGRNFIDLLGNRRPRPASPDDAAFLEKESRLRERIDSLRTRLADAENDAERPTVEVQLAQATRALEDLIVETRARRPELSDFVEVRPAALDQLQTILGDRAALVEYFLAHEELIAWVLREGRVHVVRRPIDRPDFERRVTAYRRRIQALEPVDEMSRTLYGDLLAPVHALIADAPVVGIVPHGVLHYVSFASLRGPSGHAIDDYALFYLPSASVLPYTAAKRRPDAPRRVLAVGDPDLGDPALALPFARKEAERLRWRFPEVDVLTGDAADEATLRKRAGQYGVVHIASHGEFDSLMPLYSALRLAPGQGQDGRLTVREVFGLTVNADLVTLSACQSGLAEVNNGDDLVGLGRAFVYAGTHALLSTLWRVDDVATAVVVKHFYRNYETTEKAEALRRAQVRVRRAWPHPAYWAGFVLTGDWK